MVRSYSTNSTGRVLLFMYLLLMVAFSCEEERIIVPDQGYSWPDNNRSYWPTDEWILSPMEVHDLNPEKMSLAEQFASGDSLMRAVLVVKDGFLVYESYFEDGGDIRSTNLWSVTKSVCSALVGFLYDDGAVDSFQMKMADLMPAYPQFDNITLHHVLTMTTGLSWNESGPRWVEWIFSEDWVAAALARGFETEPGDRFFYSSANSQFLNALIYAKKGIQPGIIAKDRLFDPLGIPFEVIGTDMVYDDWWDYTKPLDQSWRKDPNGTETAGFGLYLTARDMAKFGFLYLNRGLWENRQIISSKYIELSTRDHVTNVYGRYSYGYHWWITRVGGYPAFLASGFGGQIIGVVPSLDMVVVLKYESENPVHPVSGSSHDDMHLFELIVQAVESMPG